MRLYDGDAGAVLLADRADVMYHVEDRCNRCYDTFEAEEQRLLFTTETSSSADDHQPVQCCIGCIFPLLNAIDASVEQDSSDASEDVIQSDIATGRVTSIDETFSVPSNALTLAARVTVRDGTGDELAACLGCSDPIQSGQDHILLNSTFYETGVHCHVTCWPAVSTEIRNELTDSADTILSEVL